MPECAGFDEQLPEEIGPHHFKRCLAGSTQTIAMYLPPPTLTHRIGECHAIPLKT